MKKLQLLLMALVSVVAGAMTSSCSNADEQLPEPAPNEEGVSYEVKLNFKGDTPEFTESEEPISRAGETTPKRVYGINVWCMKTDGSQTSYSNYAYGLFDNKESMVISLLGGYKYRFECYMVEDDIESLYISDTGYTGRYPFAQKEISNTFSISSYSSDFYFYSTKITTQKSYDESKQSNSYQSNPQIGIFYGILDNFIPAQNTVATIPLYKNGYYGLRIVVNGVPDGSLRVSPPALSKMYGVYEYWDKDFTEAGSIEKMATGGFYSFFEYTDWLSRMQNYTTDETVKFTWTRANGYVQSFSKSVTLKRNVMTVLTVNLTGGAGEVALGFEEHSEEMTTENDNLDYDGGDMNDTPVNPEA